ncbi:MAG: hypothetical protein M3Z22_02030 [Verrucomicrobiota bacterium]|nr:hypothetical protein [Verrucomicrobiota bacterium]
MQVIAHDGGVIRPAASRRRQIVVAVEEPDPLAARVSPGQTNEFSAQARHCEAQPGLFLRENVEQATGAVLLAMRESH